MAGSDAYQTVVVGKSAGSVEDGSLCSFITSLSPEVRIIELLLNSFLESGKSYRQRFPCLDKLSGKLRALKAAEKLPRAGLN